MNFLKSNFTWVLVLIVIAVVIGTAYLVIVPQLAEKTQITVGDGVFKTAVMRDEESITNSMDSSRSLDRNAAEIYIYDEVGVWPVYLAGENNRDFIWISADKRVVYMLKDVKPDKSPHVQYMPKAKAKYVMALPGGSIESKSITQNKNVKFEQSFSESLNKKTQ